MKILILGHGQHGKDTAAEMISALTGMSFVSSSWFCCTRVVFPTLAPVYKYSNPQECYEDRSNHRQEWKDLISEYNTPDKSRLSREILSEFDIYVGMRCSEEFAAAKHLFDLITWVDAGKRKPKDPTMTIEFDGSMIRIDNNYSKYHLESEIRRFVISELSTV